MKTLLVILGPTGVGKTELSLQLAEYLQCPIINADSRQIYKDIEIGTASPTTEDLARVKHFFVHTLPLDAYYSAAEYEKDVLTLLDELYKTHDTLLLSGGSMMYVDAVTKGIDDIPTVDEDTRAMLRERFEKEGLEPLLAELKLLDPAYYDMVDKKNHKRVVHALEICYMTGKAYTSFRTQTQKSRPFRIVKVGLRRNREQLFERINQRVDAMMRQGLMDEVKRVYPLRRLNSLNTVGYKELFKVLDGEWELPMAVERIKKNTRVYAKKQMTWYQHDADIHWLDADLMSVTEMVETIQRTLQ
ncbi:MAG: tRNA (adenosine(37)-N6)-dimethylallyltransferase MiaA [Bacteroidaceae bacterium]|nr:tRNA (adenosine(37)-N6)-dimethylallyltransferase MiaA [Bacteroidaceae bacterium]